MTSADLQSVIPEMICGALGMLLVVLAPLFRRNAAVLYTVAIAGLGCVLGTLLTIHPQVRAPFGGTYEVDAVSTFMRVIVVIAALITLPVMAGALHADERTADAPIFVVFGTLGAMVLCGADDLALVSVALVATSTAVYVLAGIRSRSSRSREAAVKLVVFSMVNNAIMLFGFALLFGITDSLNFHGMRAAMTGAPLPAVILALCMIFAGFAFEAVIVPFHEWAPDTYQGAPGPCVLWISLAPKLAALALILRFYAEVFPHTAQLALGIVAVLSMTWGNVAGYVQHDLKRLLAYSGIGHAGFMLAAIATLGNSPTATQAFLIYAASYVAMNGAAFAVASLLERNGGIALADLAGLPRREPGAAIALTVALLSLAGFPPFVGFIAKVVVIQTAFSGGATWLGALIAFNAVLALGYYVRPLVVMWFGNGVHATLWKRGTAWAAAYALANLVLGIAPQMLTKPAATAAIANDESGTNPVMRARRLLFAGGSIWTLTYHTEASPQPHCGLARQSNGVKRSSRMRVSESCARSMFRGP